MSIVDRALIEVMTLVSRMKDEERGQGMAEYGLILALVAVLCVAAFTSLKGAIVTTLTSVTTAL